MNLHMFNKDKNDPNLLVLPSNRSLMVGWSSSIVLTYSSFIALIIKLSRVLL
jgi:hypothetical protein